MVSKFCLAAGFITGIYGLTEPSELATRTALGLIATGIVAGAYGLIVWLRRTQL